MRNFLLILLIVIVLVYYTRKFWIPILIQLLFHKIEKKVKKSFDETQNQQSQGKSHTDSSSKKKKSKMKTDDLGEYVDYEDIE